VRTAILEKLDAPVFAHTGFFTAEPAEQLAGPLAAKAPAGIERVYLVSGGSEAVEAAIKLARQHFFQTGEPARHRVIARLGPGTVMAFIAVPMVGATAGAAPAVDGHFRRVRDICDRHGVLLILDEGMCGTGRTGTLFACEQDGVASVIVTVAKGLGGGDMPGQCCAVRKSTGLSGAAR